MGVYDQIEKNIKQVNQVGNIMSQTYVLETWNEFI